MTQTTSAVQAYVRSTILLVRSLVIKSEISATRLNKSIIATYGEGAVDTSIPRTWKYYMNIAGQYHFSDQPMTVISLDTQQEIDFTVENMRIHTATAQAYRYGTRYYFSLVRAFPDQEQLIMGVINPVNLSEAIQAPDGAILTYYRDLVEPQESTLMYELQKYINNYLARYTVQGFNNIWRAYPVLNLAAMNQSLVAQIMNIRLEAVKSEKTHSFHITQYLASHGRLDRFIPYMTLKQKLYLYHNIEYIQKFAGHTDTFEELIQWILDDRRIPLSSYTVRQLQEHDSDLYPEMRARRTPLGTSDNTVESEYLAMPEYYRKESATQPGNPGYFEYHEKRITHSLATDNTSVIQTKDLESAMVDYTDAVPDPLPEVLMRQWAYMSASGLYNVAVNFNHPVTGERYSLLAKDALIYYCYVMMSAMGSSPMYVPGYLNIKFRLHPRPAPEVLYRDLVPARFPDLKEIADALLGAQPIITECFSVAAFADLTYQIYEECQVQWQTTSNTMDPMKRAIVAKMVSRLYGITSLILAPENTGMRGWLQDRSLPEFTGTYEDGIQLCNILFQQATGFIVDETRTLRSIQKAMIEMFGQLSSYSIQVMREINDSAIIPVNWPAVRVGVEGQDTDTSLQLPVPVRVNDVGLYTEDSKDVLDNGDHVENAVIIPEMPVAVRDGIYVTQCVGDQPNPYNTIPVALPRTLIYDESPAAGNQNDPFQPMEYYSALTDSELESIAQSLSLRP